MLCTCRMSAFVYSVVSGKELSDEVSVEDEMTRLIEKYRHLDVVSGKSAASSPSLDVVRSPSVLAFPCIKRTNVGNVCPFRRLS